MILLALTLATLCPTPPPAPVPADAVRAVVRIEKAPHGKLKWFRGSWEELLAAAKASEQLIFLDFTADW
jgi:hypothetical protein